ncbi:hypothetical protein GCM10022224_041390 [Nonomuraea antimicrobica]|uniref:Uncharacterized protein n=1 Tax=Nonomuraea antimicrobica TaxID=561173 RepID=A0ABP7C121_9ACTN
MEWPATISRKASIADSTHAGPPCTPTPTPSPPERRARQLTLPEVQAILRRDQTEGWIGEIEGIDLTLTCLRAKRDESERLTRRPTVDLGIPSRRSTTEPVT